MAKYRFSGFLFNEELGQLTLESDNTDITLDPRCADLLALFLASPDKVFSRDELMETVWNGAIVTENSINWSISQLRKALQDDSKNPRFIQTVSKKGYRFLLKPELITANSSVDANIESDNSYTSSTTNSYAKSSQRKWLLLTIGLVLLAAVIAVSVVLNLRETAVSRVVAVKPLTTLPGNVRGGAISPDGLYLAFLHQPSIRGNFHIQLKPLKENLMFAKTTNQGQEQQATIASQRALSSFRLTLDEANYRSVVWKEDNYKLLAVREESDACHIVELSLSLARNEIIQARELDTCHRDGHTKLVFDAKSDSVYFTDRDESSSRYQLYQYRFSENQRRLILASTESGFGFRFIDLDTHQQLLLLQDKGWRATEFVKLDLSTLEASSLFDVESVYYSAYWSYQKNRIWMNWSNSRVIEYAPDTQQSQVLLESSFGWNYDFHSANTKDKEQTVIFTVSDANASDLLKFDGQQFVWNKTPFLEEFPTFSSKTGRLAYVSNKSGLPQVWITEPDGRDYQLTNAEDYREFHDLHWSKDETSLLGVSQKVVGMLDLDSLRYSALLNNGVAPFFPKITADKKWLLVSHNIDNQWQIVRYSIAEEIFGIDPAVNNEGGEVLVDGFQFEMLSDTELVFTKYGQSGLWLFNLNTGNTALLFEEFPVTQRWQTNQHQLFYQYQGKLFQIDLTDIRDSNVVIMPTEILTLPEGLAGRFDVAPDSRRFVFEDRRKTQSDLKIGRFVSE